MNDVRSAIVGVRISLTQKEDQKASGKSASRITAGVLAARKFTHALERGRVIGGFNEMQ